MMQSRIWTVLFGDHIHTDCHGQLAAFDTKEAADKWIAMYGVSWCRVIFIDIDPIDVHQDRGWTVDEDGYLIKCA